LFQYFLVVYLPDNGETTFSKKTTEDRFFFCFSFFGEGTDDPKKQQKNKNPLGEVVSI